MGFGNLLKKCFLVVGFLSLAILLTSGKGDRVAEIPAGQSLLAVGPCYNKCDCSALCKSNGELTLYGVVCRKRIPPHKPGPPNDCFCRF